MEHYILKNHETGETIDFGLLSEEESKKVYDKAKEKSHIKEIHYARFNLMPTGERIVDFGSYTWFIHIK